MWPFSRIRSLRDDVTYWRTMSEEQARLLNELITKEQRLLLELELAKRNDSPRDPKTGKFRKGA